MRTKNAVRNIKWSLIFQLFLFILGLIMPRLIILTFGSAVNGLTSTINYIISIINLLQAGAVGASIYTMYKPVSENDYETISRIMYSSRRYFHKLGIIFLLLIAMIAPILGILKSSDEIRMWEIIISTLILGIGASYSFFFIYWYDIVFQSYQRRFILSIASLVDKMVYYGLLFIIIYFKLNFILMYVAVVIGTTVNITILYLVYCKTYKQHIHKINDDDVYPIHNRKYLLINTIAVQAVDSAPVILVSMLYGFKYVSVYSVYNLVQNSIKMLINTVQYSISAIFGNLIVSEDKEKIESVFNLLEFLFAMLCIFFCSCTIALYMPFIRLYTAGITDANYIIQALPVLMVMYAVVYCFYMPFYMLTNISGLFRETYLQAAICAGIGIVLAFLFGKVFFPLVLMGPLFYYLSSILYRLWVCHRKVEWFTFRNIGRRAFAIVTFCTVAYFIGNRFISCESWFSWVLYAVITACLVSIVMLIYALLFEKEEINQCLVYTKLLFMK